MLLGTDQVGDFWGYSPSKFSTMVLDPIFDLIMGARRSKVTGDCDNQTVKRSFAHREVGGESPLASIRSASSSSSHF